MLNKVCFDWISFTIKDMDLKELIYDLGLPIGEFSKCKFGKNGYNTMLMHDVFPVQICFDGNDNMGIHVSVSSGGLKYFMECFSAANCRDTPFGYGVDVERNRQGVFGLLASYVMKYGKFSRVDVCIDTDMPFMNPRHLAELTRKKEMVSTYRFWKVIEDSEGGFSLNIGRRTSNSCIRIYDKAAEQKKHDETLYRFEAEFKDKGADGFMKNFLENGLSCAFHAFISKSLRFVPDGDYFDAPYEEWQEFLNLVSSSPVVEYVSYLEKKNKQAPSSVLHMMLQYKRKLGVFLTEFADVDDFLELMNVILVYGYTFDNELANYCHLKGWDV